MSCAGAAFNWTAQDSYNAQSLCAYETVALGYSSFCGLFTYEEWEGYEYSVDINFAGNNAFQSPTGRAVGAGYVAEIQARLENHLITKPTAQINTTLDSQNSTFPVSLDQNLFFDFSHDTNIMAILTAFGLTQFAEVLPDDHIKQDRALVVSHMVISKLLLPDTSLTLFSLCTRNPSALVWTLRSSRHRHRSLASEAMVTSTPAEAPRNMSTSSSTRGPSRSECRIRTAAIETMDGASCRPSSTS